MNVGAFVNYQYLLYQFYYYLKLIFIFFKMANKFSVSDELLQEIENNKLANGSDLISMYPVAGYYISSSPYYSFNDLCSDNTHNTGMTSTDGKLPFHIKEYSGQLHSFNLDKITSSFVNEFTSRYFSFSKSILTDNSGYCKLKFYRGGDTPSGSISSYYCDINMCGTVQSCALVEGVEYKYNFIGGEDKNIILTTKTSDNTTNYPGYKITINTSLNNIVTKGVNYILVIKVVKKNINLSSFDVELHINIFNEKYKDIDFSNKNKLPRLKDIYFSTEKNIPISTGLEPGTYYTNVKLGKMALIARTDTNYFSNVSTASGFSCGTFGETLGPSSTSTTLKDYYAGSTQAFQIGDCLGYKNKNFIIRFPNLEISNLISSENSQEFNIYYRILYSNGKLTNWACRSNSPYSNETSKSITDTELKSGMGIYLGDLSDIMYIDAVQICLRPLGTGGLTADKPTLIKTKEYPFRMFYNYNGELLNNADIPKK